jgi:hypothetical protein
MKNLVVAFTLVSSLLAASFARADEPDRVPKEAAAPKSAVGVFVGMEWRGTFLAGSAGHGPGAQAGVLLFRRHLKVGIAGFARPGPINPAEYDVAPANGATYKGQRELRLRSDGALIGLVVAPVFDMPGVPQLSVELPITLGQGGFGFYLHGEDRVTPDGRKPSAWENELLAGKDSSFGMGIDAGLRFAWKGSDASAVQPYIAAHYSTVLGFDTLVRGSYAGPSVAVGVQIGTF